MSDYQYEAASITGLVAQVVRYVSSGHFFYVRSVIPAKKDPRQVDTKLLERFGANKKRWQRKRRELKDAAAVHYIRHRNLAVLMASKGRHDEYYSAHGSAVKDIRRESLVLYDYDIRYAYSETEKRWKVSVRLEPETYRKVKAHMLAICVWHSYRNKEVLEREFSRLPYQPYSPVFKQLLAILREVNRARRRRGFEKLDPRCIKSNRRMVKVFAQPTTAEDEAA